MVRIAQGLVNAAKGLVTASPFYSDGFLYSKVAMAGLFITANSMLDCENILVGKFNFVFYYLVCSIYPRMTFTVSIILLHILTFIAGRELGELPNQR